MYFYVFDFQCDFFWHGQGAGAFCFYNVVFFEIGGGDGIVLLGAHFAYSKIN